MVISQTCIRHDMRKFILYPLKLFEVLFRRAVEQRVTVIDPCTDDAASDHVSHFSHEVTSNMAQRSYMKVTLANHAVDMILEHERAIECNTKCF